MWVFVMIVIATLVLFACERWIGSCPVIDQDGAEFSKQCLPGQLSSREVACRIIPLFLGGLGLPLTLAHPLPGILCLVMALGLFFIGRK